MRYHNAIYKLSRFGISYIIRLYVVQSTRQNYTLTILQTFLSCKKGLNDSKTESESVFGSLPMTHFYSLLEEQKKSQKATDCRTVRIVALKRLINLFVTLSKDNSCHQRGLLWNRSEVEASCQAFILSRLTLKAFSKIIRVHLVHIRHSRHNYKSHLTFSFMPNHSYLVTRGGQIADQHFGDFMRKKLCLSQRAEFFSLFNN